MSSYTEIIKSPIITEASLKLVEKENKYTFKVIPSADKFEIANAVEKLFKVSVLSVNTMNYPKKEKSLGKYKGFRASYKKAIVELASGQKIAAFNV